MQRITWYALLAVATLVAPTACQTRTSQTQPTTGPQPNVRQIASIQALVDDAVLMPNRRVILYLVNDDKTSAIFAYDLASKRSTLVTGHCTGGLSVSPAGNLIAFNHEAESPGAAFVATMPINPATGAAAGPAKRLSVGTNYSPNFSPDGRLVALNSVIGAQRVLAVVPAVGGPERILSRDANMYPIAWSADGKWIFVEVDGAVPPERSVARIPIQGGPVETLFSYAGRAASIGAGVAFYMERDTKVSRMLYVTRSGERGEFSVPPGTIRGRHQNLESGAKWLVLQRPLSGTTTSAVYELDVSPLLQVIRKR